MKKPLFIALVISGVVGLAPAGAMAWNEPGFTLNIIRNASGDTGFRYTVGCINGVKHAIVTNSGYGPHGNSNFAITLIVDAQGKPVACESAPAPAQPPETGK